MSLAIAGRLHTSKVSGLFSQPGQILMLLAVSLAFMPEVPLAQGASAQRSTGLELTEPTVEKLQAFLLQVDASELPDLEKEQLRSKYRSAIDNLRFAQQRSSELRGLTQRMQEASQRIAEIRIKLSRPPLPPTDLGGEQSLSDLQSALTRAVAELAVRRGLAAERLRENSSWQERRRQLPENLSDSRQKVLEIQGQAPDLAVPGDPLLRDYASAVLAEAQLVVERQQVELIEFELATAETRSSLLQAEMELSGREVEDAELAVDQLRLRVLERRRRVAEEDMAEARRRVADAPPGLEDIAGENLALAQLRVGEDGLTSLRTSLSSELDRVTRLSQEIEGDFLKSRTRVEVIGRTGLGGVLLQGKMDELPRARNYEQRLEQLRVATREIQIKQLNFTDQRNELSRDFERQVQLKLGELAPQLSPEQVPGYEERIRLLLRTRLEMLRVLEREAEEILGMQVELDAALIQLVIVIRQYRAFVAETTFWMPSAEILTPDDLKGVIPGFAHFLSVEVVRSSAAAIREGISPNRAKFFTLILFAVVLLALRPFWKRELLETGRTVGGDLTAPLKPTLRALVDSVLLGLLGPYVFWAAREIVQLAPDMPAELAAANQALASLMPGVFGLFLVLSLMRRGGLAESHLGLPEIFTKSLRRASFLLLLIVFPLIWLAGSLFAFSSGGAETAAGRVLLIAGVLATSLIFERAFRRWRNARSASSTGFQTRSTVWGLKAVYWVSFLFPLSLSVISALGYPRTASDLAERFFPSLWVALGGFLLYFGLRRVVMARHRSWTPEWLRNVASSKLIQEGQEGEAEQQARLKMEKIDAQALWIIGWVLFAAVLGALGLLWGPVLPALSFLGKVKLWSISTAAGEESISLGAALFALVLVPMFFIVVRNTEGLLEFTVLPWLPSEQGLRFAVVTVTRYVLTAMGILWVAALLGVRWDKVQWLLAGVSVGIGFGLQEVVANFISGLILLFERPIRVGDHVTIGTVTGQVTDIRMRATTILDYDRKELLVPNKDFVTGQVVNWTLTDSVCRYRAEVGVAYGSDTALVERLLLEAANNCPGVLRDPPPRVMFSSFGDNSLNFVVFIFLPDRSRYFETLHELHMEIDAIFRREGIVIAFPQRDVHLDSLTPIEVRLVNQESDAAARVEGKEKPEEGSE